MRNFKWTTINGDRCRLISKEARELIEAWARRYEIEIDWDIRDGWDGNYYQSFQFWAPDGLMWSFHGMICAPFYDNPKEFFDDRLHARCLLVPIPEDRLDEYYDPDDMEELKEAIENAQEYVKKHPEIIDKQ